MDHIHPSNNSRVAILLFALIAVVTFLYIRFFSTYQSNVPNTQPENQQVIDNMLSTPAPNDDVDTFTNIITSQAGDFSLSYPVAWRVIDEQDNQETANGKLIQSWILQNSSESDATGEEASAEGRITITDGTVRMQIQLYESEDGSEVFNTLFSCEDKETIECTKETVNGVTFSKVIQETPNRDLQIDYGTIQNGVFYLISSSLFSADASLEEQVQTIVGTTWIRTQN